MVARGRVAADREIDRERDSSVTRCQQHHQRRATTGPHMALKAIALAALPLLAAAHSNVIIPRPRNSIDALTDSRFGSCSLGKGCSPLEVRPAPPPSARALCRRRRR